MIDTDGMNSSSSKQRIIKQIENTVKHIFANFEDVNVSMIFVTHESPDTISFIIGDQDLEFHRPTMTIEHLFGLDKESSIEKVDDSKASKVSKLSSYEDIQTLSPMAKMWISFALFILYFVISYAAIIVLKFLFSKNLSRTNNPRKSVNIRIGYSIVRFVLRIIIIGGGIVLGGILFVNAIDVNQYLAISILCGGGGLLISLISSLSLPMNFMTMKSFMSKNRDFSLYLRGFITDNYTPSMEKAADTVSNAAPWKTKIDSEEKEMNPNELSLNEKSLAKAWKKYYQTYSVGRPEELESPEGTKRIYLDNESWQGDVKTLMELAKYILVCIHPNDNCIWEIRQCNTLFPEKTIYYVDDIINFGVVREKMGNELPVCLKSKEIDHNHLMVYQNNGQVVVRWYNNTDGGLSAAVDDIFN